jgi:DNA-binding GntR family transcriptional regulator
MMPPRTATARPVSRNASHAANRLPAHGKQAAGPLVLQAYSALRARILDNTYPPGHQALESALADELGISRTPLREALIRLQQEGLVEVVPRHGMRVLPVSARDMEEIYQILAALESSAAEMLAARKPSTKELAPLVNATRDMGEALKRDDLRAWAEADERFHLSLIDLAGNRLLAQAVAAYWDRAHRARMFTLKLRPKPVHSTAEHARIVESIAQGNPQTTGELYRAHRQRASKELLGILHHFGLLQL